MIKIINLNEKTLEEIKINENNFYFNQITISD